MTPRSSTETMEPRPDPLRRRGFVALLGAEFCGAVNDNLYKMLISLLAIGTAAADSSGLLPLTGVAIILPYLLFAGRAGQLADRLSKRRVFVALKAVEIPLMAAALATLVVGRVDLMLAVLFLTAAQSALSSPAKYGLLPELLPVAALSQANGLLQFCRYSAIIFGTVTGGALLAAWPERPAVGGGALIAVAVVGWLASRHIDEPPPRGGPARPRLGAWRELADGIRRIGADRVLRPVVIGTCWFDFLSTLVMLDVLLLAKQVVGLDDLRTGLLGAAAGIGIGVGSVAAGRLSGGRIRPGLVPLGVLAVALVLLIAPLWGGAFGSAAAALALLGFASGFYVVPLNALLQHRPRREETGQVIAANNFLNMMGVLLGSAGVWLLHDVAGLPPPWVLTVAGAATLGFATAAGLAVVRPGWRALAHARGT